MKMDSSQADLGGYVMAQLLTKLDRHPRYREIFVPQYEQLTGGAMSLALGEDIRAQVAALAALIPDKPLRLSFDPQRLRAWLHRFEQVREDNPNSEEQLGLLAGILLRLDRAANYPELVAQVQGLGEHAWPVCAEIVQQVGDKDRARVDILRAARVLLEQQKWACENDAEERIWEWPSLVHSLYMAMGVEHAGQRDQAL